MSRFVRAGLLGIVVTVWAAVVPVELLGETADPRCPPAIETSDVPPLPADLVESLQQYLSARSASFDGFAPDGKGILIGTRFSDTTQLHRVYAPGGRREQITFQPEPVNGTFLPGSADALLVSWAEGGNEQYQIHLFKDRRFTLLTDGKSRNQPGPMTRDGSLLAYTSNRRNGRDTDTYVVDPQRPDSARMVLETKGEFWSPSDWSPDKSKLLMRHYVSANESRAAILDLASGSMTFLPAPSKAPKISWDAVAYAADGKSVYVVCDARGEFQQLAKLDLAEGTYEWLTRDIPWDVSGIEVDPQSHRVAFTTNEHGASSLYLLDQGKRRRLDVPMGVIAGLEFSPSGQELGFTLARADAPADAYSIQLADGKLVRWTYSEVGGLDPSRFVTPRLVEFPSFDGRTIPAFYYPAPRASKDAPAPVLISIHGGPEGQYRPLFSPTFQFYLSQLGISVLAPNVRGSSGYGKTYVALDNAQQREDSVKDIGALLDWVGKQPELDASRVGVIGGSYGGYMVLGCLVNFPDRFRAGIDIVGIASFKTFLRNTSAYRQDLRRAEYGDERDPQMQAFFDRIDPLHRAEQIRSALLVAHGRNDPRVPFSEAEQIASKVRSAGKAVWTVYADNEGHGFAKKANGDYLAGAISLFLQEKLVGAAAKDSPAPERGGNKASSGK